ncbi:hypothetical protein PCASD_00020 [Puccinia coronata f. sp. avenae]|uniref:Uncharacterized protein n=1 Tax=Puccinia coronata f. sp. avenae TaxID=200324 RepID=A0A2N5VR05_9BASI|nr:hypothetical protein PCASD_00020 [Puccinia coronata f. sp. avenae]
MPKQTPQEDARRAAVGGRATGRRKCLPAPLRNQDDPTETVDDMLTLEAMPASGHDAGSA